MKAPQFLKKYFWDIDFTKFNVETHPKFVIERILEYGNDRAIVWMMKHFKKDEIIAVLTHLRGISPKSANFWAVVFNVSREKVICLQKPYLEIRRKHWPY